MVAKDMAFPFGSNQPPEDRRRLRQGVFCDVPDSRRKQNPPAFASAPESVVEFF